MSGNSLRSLLEQKGRWNKQAWDRWKNSIKHLQESTSVILKPLAFLRPYVSLNCCHLKEFSYTDLVNLLIELVIRQLLRIEKYFIHVLSKSCSPPKIRSLKNLCSASLIAFFHCGFLHRDCDQNRDRDQIRSFLYILSDLLKKSLTKGFIFCAVLL